jgi:hypothetical protein
MTSKLRKNIGEIIGSYLDCPTCGLTLDLDSDVGVQGTPHRFQIRSEFFDEFAVF